MFAKRIKDEIHPGTWAVIGRKDMGNNQHQIGHRGTAFAIDRHGHLVTCWHVLFMDQDCKVRCDFLEVGQPNLGSPIHKAQVLGEDRDRDLAVLQMEGAPRTKPVRLVREEIGHGTTCGAFGHPLSIMDSSANAMRIFARASAGVVSMPFNANRWEDSTKPVRMYELDVFSHGGASGGAVFLPDGRVFGVISGSRTLDDGNGHRVPMNLSLAIDIREAIELLKSLNINT